MLRHRLHAILDGSDRRDPLARTVDWSITVLIVLNVAAVVAETVPGFGDRNDTALLWFERASLTVFAVEYALRLWSCTVVRGYARPVAGRLRYALRPFQLVDLIAILPGLLHVASFDLRVLRLLRLLRLLKLGRHSASLHAFGRVLKSRAPELGSTLFVMLMLLVMSSSLMYFLERDDNPAFSSIPAAMWWGIATFTTVGYGDITPVTAAGRLLGGATAILGIAMFAIPAGVLGAAFSDEMAQRRQRKAARKQPNAEKSTSEKD